MSDSAPLMMNLGAEVTPAVAPGTPLGGLEPANGNGFAGVLGKVMQGMPTEGTEHALSPEQLLANQLLLAKLDNPDPGMQQDPDKLANLLLQGGKPLPSDETEVSWQSLFGHYDSTDAESPYLVAMEGDNEGYSVSELNPEGLIEHTEQYGESPEQALNPVDLKQANALLQERIDLARLQASLRGTAQSTEMAGVEGIAELGRAGQKEANPVLSAQDTEVLDASLSDQQRLREALATQLNNRQTVQAEQPSGEEVGQQELKGLEAMSKVHMQQNPAQQAELNNMKLDVVQQVAAQDAGGSKIQPTTNMVGGASAYAALSGTGSTAVSPPSGANVIANLTVPPENPGWGDVVGNRVQWMVNQKIQEAQIRLNPPELGMLEIRIQIGQDQQTSVSFSSPHAQVRDALENAMPRLREMFGENGLDLGNVDVSQHSMADQRQAEQGKDESHQGKMPSGRVAESQDSGETTNPISMQADGMLDLYA